MNTEPAFPLFVYGTLRDAGVLAAALGRPVESLRLCPATAPGWRTVPYPGEIYPALIPATRHAAPGLLIEGLTLADIAQLDIYEGNQYARKALTVVSGAATVKAVAYLPVIDISPDAPQWTLQQWIDALRTEAGATR